MAALAAGLASYACALGPATATRAWAATPAVVPVAISAPLPRPRPPHKAPNASQSRPPLQQRSKASCRLTDPARRWAKLPRWARDASLETMIGQLLVVSFLGDKPGEAGVKRTVQALADGRIGGVLYFGYNVGTKADLVAVNKAFASANPQLPALIAIDQEGGAVSRLPESIGVPATPRAKTVARGGAREAARTYGRMASAMAALGFNVNLGPVVDLDINPKNPVIGRFGRSYGEDPATVVAYADAFIEAHRRAGIATALKHFPGHGSSSADSHDHAIDLTRSWREEEVEPYVALIHSGQADMVMVGHLILDTLKGDGPPGLPATLSRALITGFLRETLCFDGIVISDDLKMDAIEKRWSVPKATAMSLAAGSDLILVTVDANRSSIDAIVGTVAEAARRDRALAARIRDAYARVVLFKLTMASRSN